jgi:hypothetical protein
MDAPVGAATAAASLTALQEQGDRADLRRVDQIVDQVGRTDLHLVAGGDQVGEADALLDAVEIDRRGDRARCRYDRDIARQRLRSERDRSERGPVQQCCLTRRAG